MRASCPSSPEVEEFENVCCSCRSVWVGVVGRNGCPNCVEGFVRVPRLTDRYAFLSGAGTVFRGPSLFRSSFGSWAHPRLLLLVSAFDYWTARSLRAHKKKLPVVEELYTALRYAHGIEDRQPDSYVLLLALAQEQSIVAERRRRNR